MMVKDKLLFQLVPLEIWAKYDAQYTEVPLMTQAKDHYKISICTTCMGRTYDLKKTYQKNIDSNKSYPNIEFVLLNYNSKDDMDEWVKTLTFPVRYVKVTDPVYYNMADSRNRAFHAATGDILVNVDADMHIKEGFAFHLNNVAHMFKTRKMILIKSRQRNRGLIAIFKEVFEDLGGYGKFDDYGFEDYDLIARAYHSGCKVVKFGGEFSDIIKDHERHPVSNYKEKDWKYTQRRNALISLLGIASGKFKI